MSWNNALPIWMYMMLYEHELAKMSCCFEDEWYSGVSKIAPDHVFLMSRSNFSSWEPGGWNDPNNSISQ
jgi:hypothetical protein